MKKNFKPFNITLKNGQRTTVALTQTTKNALSYLAEKNNVSVNDYCCSAISTGIILGNCNRSSAIRDAIISELMIMRELV